MERAGEPIGGTKSSCIPTTASGLARPTGTVKGSSIASLATTNVCLHQDGNSTLSLTRLCPQPKPTSAIPAVSRFPNLPRPPPVTNFSQTLGPGSRPPVGNPRLGPSMNFTPSVHNRPRANTRPRPATAMGSHELEEDEQEQQPNGTKLSPSLHVVARRQRKKLRESISFDSISVRSRHQRDVSTDLFRLSKQMQQLSIDHKTRRIHERGQVIFQGQVQPGPKQLPEVKVHLMAHGMGREQSQDAPVLDAASTTPEPSTPRRSTDMEAHLGKVETAIKSLCKHPLSPFKSSSPSKSVYLTKDSNLTSYIGFDVAGRLDEVESQFKQMKEAMNVSLTDRKTLEDAVDLAKTRGRWSLPLQFDTGLWVGKRPLERLERVAMSLPDLSRNRRFFKPYTPALVCLLARDSGGAILPTGPMA